MTLYAYISKHTRTPYIYIYIYIYIYMMYVCMYICMYICMYVCIPCVSSPLVSGIVYVCMSYMRSPESPVPRSPALYMYAYFIWDSLSLQSPGLRHLYIIPGVSSPQISKILYLCIFSMCTIPNMVYVCLLTQTLPPRPPPNIICWPPPFRSDQ